MVSRSARAISTFLGLVPDIAKREAMTHPLRRRRQSVAPGGLSVFYDVTEARVADGTVVTARPRDRSATRHLFYLHGGAYTLEDQHWPFLRLLVDRGWTVHLVDYPLAPEHTVDATVATTLAAWDHVLDLADGRPVSLAGDSAGGGLALVLLQQLRDAGTPASARPDATVLLSPWVDLVMADAATVAAARHDVLLSLRGLRGCVELYRGDRDPTDPKLSPINGGLHDLGRIQTWVGTAEMFLPQCRLLADRAAAESGTALELHLAHGLLHDWALFPVPERDLLVEEMLTFLG